MITLFENLTNLFENELYTNVIRLATLMLSAYNHNHSLLTPHEHYLCLVYYAESLLYERQYRKAEAIYRQSLYAKKMLGKTNKIITNNKPLETIVTTQPLLNDPYPDSELKYKIAKCLYAIKQPQDAVSVLQTIPVKLRVVKVNALLGHLMSLTCAERGAVSAYKEVLKECPLALVAIEGILKLGVKGIEVDSMILNTTSSPQCSEWLSSWIKAHALAHSRKYTTAIQTLKLLETNSIIKDYNYLHLLIGECYYQNGESEASLNYMRKAYNSSSGSPNCLIRYSMLLAQKNNITELEKLIIPCIPTTEYTSENWYVMAQYLYSTGKYEKAAYFAQKSCFMNLRNVDACLLKAKIFIELKKYKEALDHLTLVQQCCPYRFDIHKSLVETYLSMNRLRDAQTIAHNAVKKIGQSPRTLVLLAQTYAKDVMAKFKAKPFLEKALELDELYLPAVYMLAEILQGDCDIQQAKLLLRNQLRIQSNCKLHTLLGNLLHIDNDQNGALEHYTIALTLDPTNRQALAGLLAMGQTAKLDTSYTEVGAVEEAPEYRDSTFEMVQIPATVSVDQESIESDAMWSDMEIEINTST